MSLGALHARLRVSLTQVWVAAVVMLPVIALLNAPLSMIDLAYQIRAGEFMLRSHEVLRSDPLSFASMPTWFDQQWLAQVLLAALFQIGGWLALVLLRASLAAGIAILVFLGCRAYELPRKRAALLTLASMSVAYTGMSLRPQLFALLLFAGTVWVLATRGALARRLVLIPVLSVVWVNVHGSFFLAPLLVGLAFLEELRSGRNGRALLLAAGGSILASGANPHGFAVWAYVWRLSTNPVITQRVQEWQRTSPLRGWGPVFFASALAVAWLLARRRRIVTWPTLVAVGVFFLLGAMSVRGVHWWALAVPAIIAPLLGTTPEVDHASGMNVVILGVLVVIAGALCARWIVEPEAHLVDAPTHMTERLLHETTGGERVFAAQAWGSWFELALPDDTVFVDSRIELYPPARWRAYDTVSGGRQGWEAVLDRWGVTFVAAERDQQAGLLRVIGRSDDWSLVYRDASGSLYRRR
jgi:hypothetical protein